MKFIDNEEMFTLNPDMTVYIEKIGGDDPHGGGFRDGCYPVVVMEDVYKYPDRIRKFADSLPIPHSNCNYDKYYGHRITIDNFIANKDFLNTVSMLLVHKLEMFDMITWSDATNNNQFCLNVIHNDEECSVSEEDRKQSYVPHSDPSVISSIIYLNRDDELETTGTGLYRHIKSDLVGFPQSAFHEDWIADMEMKGSIPIEAQNFCIKKEVLSMNPTNPIYDECILANNDEWQLLHKFEGKYNSMVSYMGGMFHSALYDVKEVTNVKRLTQAIFWDFIPELKENPQAPPVITPRQITGEPYTSQQ